jgi:hypothetical protein
MVDRAVMERRLRSLRGFLESMRRRFANASHKGCEPWQRLSGRVTHAHDRQAWTIMQSARLDGSPDSSGSPGQTGSWYNASV